MKYKLEIFADYFQIYIEDEAVRIDVSGSWTTKALENLIAFDPHTNQAFAMATVRNMTVPLEIEILNAKPLDEDFSNWDQINECSITLPSGAIVVSGCGEYRPEAKRIQLKPDIYRARVYYAKLDSLSENGLEGNDHYRIVFWTEAFRKAEIIKSRKINL